MYFAFPAKQTLFLVIPDRISFADGFAIAFRPILWSDGKISSRDSEEIAFPRDNIDGIRPRKYKSTTYDRVITYKAVPDIILQKNITELMAA